MTDAELAPQLDDLEALLTTVEEVVDAFEGRLKKLGDGIESLDAALPKLDSVLAVAENAQAPDQATYNELAKALFTQLSDRLKEADSTLDISFDPAQALDGLTDSVNETLGDVAEFVSDAAEEFDTVMDGLDTLMAETIVEDIQNAVNEWQGLSEEAVEKVSSASQTFEDARTFSTEELETEIKERLEDAMGSHVSKIAQDIDAVFDSAEEVLDKADSLVGQGVGNVTDVANKVLVVQKAIKDLRPVLEILL